ncbi:APG6-domain-containing protein [Lichtheimia hyalospora FSU 10163]|nr:APG6-domain-containing protein [Lichtheimia hyalospora FSU 10163]
MQAFTCQRCKQPLRIDDSLADLDSASADLLTAPLSAEEQYQQQLRQQSSRYSTTKDAITKRHVGVGNKLSMAGGNNSSSNNRSMRDSLPLPSESFVVLTRSQVGQNQVPSSSSPLASYSSFSPATTSTAIPSSSAPSNHHITSPHTTTTTTTTSNHQQHQHHTTTTTTTTTTTGSPSTHDDTGNRNNSLSHRLRVANRLFNIISSKSSIDHPMCQECTDLLLESLEKELEDVGRERDAYIEFFAKIKENRVDDDMRQELEHVVEQLKEAEKEALAELTKVQGEHELVQQELEELERELKALDDREERFWEQYNDYEIKLENFQNERDSINLKYDHDVKQYERLQRTVVYNDAFCISQDGPFGTINGFRLGRLSSHPVEWSEINAACGQTLLLLYTVANKLKFQFKTYRLVPMGSFSRVEKVDGDIVNSYELYGSEIGLSRMFLNRRFDHAMEGMLNCLKQLTDFAEERDRSLRFPYRIHKDKIGDLSIRVQFNQDEAWTRALKYMLTNMKWVLVFASRANVSVESH